MSGPAPSAVSRALLRPLGEVLADQRQPGLLAGQAGGGVALPHQHVDLGVEEAVQVGADAAHLALQPLVQGGRVLGAGDGRLQGAAAAMTSAAFSAAM
jgi:hypothetical protein